MKTKIIYLLTSLFLLNACASLHKEEQDGYSYLQKSVQIKPSYSEDYFVGYRFYSKNDTSVICYLNLDPTQFLARRDSSEQLNRQFSIHFIAKKNKIAAENLFQKSRYWKTLDSLPLTDSIEFMLPLKKDCWTELVITDENKHLFSAVQSWWIRENEGLKSKLILKNPSNFQPLVAHFSYSDTLIIHSDIYANKAIQISTYSNLNKPANAPFAITNSEPDFTRPDSIFSSKFNQKNFQIVLKNQFVKIQPETETEAIGFFNFSNPTEQCEELCMNYICTKAEMEELKKSTNKSNYMTQFWRKAAKQDTLLAQKLQAEFNKRIAFANQQFSSYKIGSLTDRGMIYIVFGLYLVAEKTDFKEKWIYSNTGNELNEFVFHQNKNEIFPNHFVLERDVNFKSMYYFAVEKWRDGIIEMNN